jgi:miniconductance mechanosensitive channel
VDYSFLSNLGLSNLGLSNLGLDNLGPWIQTIFGLSLLAVLALSARLLARWLLVRTFGFLRASINAAWLQIVLSKNVLRRLAQAVPWLVVQAGVAAVPDLPTQAESVISNVAVALAVLHVVRALFAMLDALLLSLDAAIERKGMQMQSIKSYVQLGKLFLIFIGSIVIIAVLSDRSPLILLSGLGAMSAVLMLVFKDTILSFTAGVHLASNDLLRIGDWIEMPQVGADGDVIDIALHTVKVQNWDKTITTIPTWRLMSESYRNWRGMSLSGGRRIKRSLSLDVSSVHFLSEREIAALSRITLLESYLKHKVSTLLQANDSLHKQLGEQAGALANERRLTNIGTFRAYVEAYLRAHPGINQGMILMVRTLESTAAGTPLELYCFTATTAWIGYEATQSDIFDHLLSILPEFGLRLYQSPSGNDVQLGLGRN